ncbi:hypothetical protein DAI22_09g173200 [Oryza sativa Japonica Group]|nr:hypothetical protein DAI22_09g173200 [Oryza sativa Japonica Group]
MLACCCCTLLFPSRHRFDLDGSTARREAIDYRYHQQQYWCSPSVGAVSDFGWSPSSCRI